MEQKTQLIQELQNCIRSVESGSRAGAEQTVSSGCSALDRLLPESGYQRGSLVQWITAGGNGVDYLSLVTAREACRNGGSLVVIDPANQFYPPAATAIGLPLERTIIPTRPSDSVIVMVSIFAFRIHFAIAHQHGIT